jgi:hypothetical protein
MHAPRSVPADVHDFVVVPIAVHDRLSLDLTMRRLVSRVFLDQTLHDQAVLFGSIHSTTLFCSSSNTTKRRPSFVTISWPNRDLHTKAEVDRR